MIGILCSISIWLALWVFTLFLHLPKDWFKIVTFLLLFGAIGTSMTTLIQLLS